VQIALPRVRGDTQLLVYVGKCSLEKRSPIAGLEDVDAAVAIIWVVEHVFIVRTIVEGRAVKLDTGRAGSFLPPWPR
jgi:hypothetical protein